MTSAHLDQLFHKRKWR